MMESSCWIEGVYWTEYHFRKVKAFWIFTSKGILDEYWIVWVFEIVSVFEM